jgi:hypothetical protein
MRITLLIAALTSTAPAALTMSTADAGEVDMTKQRISLEADALPYIFSGYDVVLGYQPSWLPRARVIASHHSFELPGPLLSDDWHGDLRAVTLHGQYFSRAGGRGWMAGIQLAYTDFDITRDSAPGMTADLDQLEVAAFGGYRWFPFDTGLFVVGWLKVGLPVNVGGDAMLGGDEFPTRPVSVYPSIHLGYEVQL